MDRLNEILKQSREKASASTQHIQTQYLSQSPLTARDLGKFFKENRLPRYLLYGIIFVKMTTIYDKLKQIVAINNIYSQMVKDDRLILPHYVKDENMLKDMLTRKILEEKQYIEDEEELERGRKQEPPYAKTSLM